MQCDNEMWTVYIIPKSKNSYKKNFQKSKAWKLVRGLFVFITN